MEFEAGDLRIEIESNSYHVQDKKRFLAYAQMLSADKQECFDFAYDMTYGRTGEHRDHRSGGTLQRTLGQVFINTYQGKMAEFALYRFFLSRNIQMEKPDTGRYELGQWDSFDLECQGKHISVKSTKEYGNLLLLETKDWNDNGEYVPNVGQENSSYDYTILVRFSPDGEQIMKNNKLLYQKAEEIPCDIRHILEVNVRDIEWQYDFPGFIFHSELVKMIKDKHIIPKGALLNGRVLMDAENYYFQAGNMHSLVDSYTLNQDTKEKHSGDMLIRTCPDCGGRLVIRNGPYSDFWGCTGYPNGCRHQEPLEQRN